jgi:hypothetical protein
MSTAMSSSRTAAITSEPHPALLRAYRDTRYEAAGIAISIGRRSAALDDLLAALGGRRAALLTAWNPRSRHLPDGVNLRRQRLLHDHLRRHLCIPAHGRLHGWREEKLLVIADPRLLAAAARRFGQSAIVVLAARRPARLMLL